MFLRLKVVSIVQRRRMSFRLNGEDQTNICPFKTQLNPDHISQALRYRLSTPLILEVQQHRFGLDGY